MVDLVLQQYTTQSHIDYNTLRFQDSDTEADSDHEEQNEDDGAKDYDYLLGMPMWNLTKEKKDELLKKEQEKVHELESLKAKTPEMLWITDLDTLREELEKVSFPTQICSNKRYYSNPRNLQMYIKWLTISSERGSLDDFSLSDCVSPFCFC